ncbi:MAG: ParA family protein [Thermus sp.]
MREKLTPLSVWARQQGVSESLARMRAREGVLNAVRLGRYWYVREVVEEPKGPGQVFTLFTHAGGAGKTSLARDLGFELASRGRKVLLVDADPQANLTAWWGVYEVDEGNPSYPPGKRGPTLPPDSGPTWT